MDDQTATETATADPESDTESPMESLGDALGEEGQLIDEIESVLGDQSGQTVAPVELQELGEADAVAGATMRDLDLLADVEVEVAVEFGRTRMPLRDLLSLRQGSLVELARRPEQKVTVLANGTPIAYGDIVVVGEQLGVHIVELVEPTESDPSPQPSVVVEEPQAPVSEPDPGDEGAAQ